MIEFNILLCVLGTPMPFPLVGLYMGTYFDGAQVFFGIPYAGKTARFQHPQPLPQNNKLTQYATRGSIFPQIAGRLANIKGIKTMPMDENAFYLNVWRPGNVSNASFGTIKRPVLIWIHGGGFRSGGGSESWYDAGKLVEGGRIIVVTVNYRVGVFGGLYAPGLSDGNLGLRDLIAASNWVRKNIEAFGGDISNITIAGQSVGATYAQLLSSIETTRGWFRRAILFSPPSVIEPMTIEEVTRLHNRFVQLSGVSMLEDLRTLDTKKIIEAEEQLMKELSAAEFGSIPVPFGPVIESSFVQAGLFSDLDAARTHVEQVLLGTLSEEMATFLQPQRANLTQTAEVKSKILDYFRRKFGNEERWEYYQARRPDNSYYTQLMDAGTDWYFCDRLLSFAKELSAIKPVYVYSFEVYSKMPLIYSGHVFDIPFFFGNWDEWTDDTQEIAPMLRDMNLQENERIAFTYRNHILNFIRTGNPNGKSLTLNKRLPRWPLYADCEGSKMTYSEKFIRAIRIADEM